MEELAWIVRVGSRNNQTVDTEEKLKEAERATEAEVKAAAFNRTGESRKPSLLRSRAGKTRQRFSADNSRKNKAQFTCRF